MEGTGHGGGLMGGHSNNFMSGSSNGNSMNMMGASNGGGMGGMNNIVDTNDDAGDRGNNFMERENDEGNFKGPEKDPLGHDIKPFNDEYKSDGTETEGHSMNEHQGGDSSHGMSFSSPMHDEGEEQMRVEKEKYEQKLRSVPMFCPIFSHILSDLLALL